MTTYLVTRHAGTRNWARAKARLGKLPFVIDEVIEHLDPERLQAGDVVVGTLPVGVAAQLHKRKIAFWSLDIDVPPQRRGQELSATELAGFKARLTRYEVKEKDHHAMAPGKLPASRKAQPSLTLILVSDQLAPAAIGWLHQRTEQVALLATSSMKKKAEQLQAWFAGRAQPPTTRIMDWRDDSYPELLAQSERVATALTVEDRPNVVVNLTGGTKPMSMALQRAFGKHREQLGHALSGACVDTQHKVITDMLAQTPTDTPMRSVLNILDILALQGVKAVSAQSACRDYQRWLARSDFFELLLAPESRAWLRVWYQVMCMVGDLVNPRKNNAKAGIVQHCTAQDREFLVEWVSGPRRAPKFRVRSKNANSPAYADLRDALEGTFGRMLREQQACRIGYPGKPQETGFTLAFERSPLDELAFASGNWFEVWIATQLLDLQIDEWAQGLSIKQDKSSNELDIIALCGNQTLVIEAKSGGLNKSNGVDRKGSDALYKFDSVAGKIGTLFSERLLVSLQPLNPNDLERARTMGIKVFQGGAHNTHAKSLADLRQHLLQWVERCRLDDIQDFKPSHFEAPQLAGAKDQPGRTGSRT